jgi:hypothetical protein
MGLNQWAKKNQGLLMLAIIGALGVYILANANIDFNMPFMARKKDTQEGTIPVDGYLRVTVKQALSPNSAVAAGSVYFVVEQGSALESATISTSGVATSSQTYRSGSKVALYFESTNYFDWCTTWLTVPHSDHSDAGQTLDMKSAGGKDYFTMVYKSSTPTMTVNDNMGHSIFDDTATEEYDVDSSTYSISDNFYWHMTISQTTADRGILNWDWYDLKTDVPDLREKKSYYAMYIYSGTPTDEYASDIVVSAPGAIKIQTGTNAYYYFIELTTESQWGWRDTNDAGDIVGTRSGTVALPEFKINCAAYNGGAGYNQGVKVDYFIWADFSIEYFRVYESANSGATEYHVDDGSDDLYIGDSDTST